MNLKALRKKHNLTQAELASYLDVSRSTVAMWEAGKSEPDLQALNRIANKFGITSDELLGRTACHTDKDTPFSIRIPVYGNIAAGIPIEAIMDYDPDTADDWEEISEDLARNGSHIALRIKGSSMEPRMKTGDVIIIRVQPDVDNGDIAAVRVNGDEVTCKKINKTSDGLMLIPLNTEYETKFYTAQQIEELPVVIIGKVVELRAKF